MKTLLSIIFTFIFLPGIGQIKYFGTPDIINYPKSVYDAGTQNWSIAQDRNGLMYFANNEGVLMFNGLSWNNIKVSKSKPVRSVFIDSKDKIYIGLLNDFGVLEPDEQGLLKFYSLRYLVPKDLDDFDDIWRIHEIEDGIVFQTYEYAFLLNGKRLQVIEPKESFHFSFMVNGNLLFHETGLGIYELRNGVLQEVSWSAALKDEEITDILNLYGSSLLICTRSSGAYKLENGSLSSWETEANQVIRQEKLFCAESISDKNIIFGTILNGLLITDIDGNILQHINTVRGLQNNTVLSVFTDRTGNLWVGLDNGIDYINLNSPISYIADSKEMGTGYCARVFNGQLYLGTNQGLFVKEFDEFSDPASEFELVENTAGQVWSLDIFEEQLVCGHNDGTFLIKGKNAEKICDEEGGWKYISLIGHPDRLIGGHYNGLVLLKNGRNGWEFDRKVKGFGESCRLIHQSNNGDIWVSHGARGVYRIILNESLDSVVWHTLYYSRNGLPSDENNIILSLDGEIFVSTLQGIYEYDLSMESFRRSEKYNRLFNVDGRLKVVEKDDEGNLWYIAQNESGVLRYNEDGTYTNISLPFKQLDGRYVNEFEFIYPFNSEHVFIGIDNGFAHYSTSFEKSYRQPYKALITRVDLPYIDSTIYLANYSNTTTQYLFPFHRNAFRFYFSSPFYEKPERLLFSYYLENYSEDWSEWSPGTYKDLTNLYEGDYIFKVKAKNLYGFESTVSSFSFAITPPWRRTLLAYVIYLFIFFLGVILIFRAVKSRMRLAKVKEQETYQRELKKQEEEFERQSLISEKEIIRLRNEKLMAEMVHRDKELANQTMNILQKNKFLSRIKEEIAIINKSTQNPEVREKLDKLLKRLDRENDNKQQNKVFKTYFEEVHEEFFDRLKEKHSELSPRELYLSAYIKMNLSTKEIASLLNISVRGVEISRYRLRKKLNLSRQDNLSVYLSNI